MEPSTSATGGHSSASTSGLTGTIKARAAAQLTDQKARAADGLDALTNAVRRSTQQLRDDRHETIAEYVEGAVQQVEQFANGLRDKDLSELIGDVRRVARRHPAVFVGASFVVGMLAVRFLKSSHQNGMSGRSMNSPSFGGV